MENTQFSFNIFEIIRVALKWKKKIIGLAIIASMIAALYFFLQKNEYKASGSFFPSSAIISGRITLFREALPEWINFFGDEDEVDRAFVLGNSIEAMSHLIHKFDMAKHYGIDVENNTDGAKKVYKRFVKNFKLSRSGYKHIEVSFVDKDPVLASKIVNEAMYKTEDIFREIYKNVNIQLANALDVRTDSINVQLRIYTDSLINMRVKYNIYDIVSPGRSVVNFNAPRGSGLQYATGLEEIQIVEEIKDRLLVSKTKFMGLSNEFKTSAYKGFPMINVVDWASPNGSKSGPFRMLGVALTFILAIVFGTLLAIIIEIFVSNKEKFL